MGPVRMKTAPAYRNYSKAILQLGDFASDEGMIDNPMVNVGLPLIERTCSGVISTRDGATLSWAEAQAANVATQPSDAAIRSNGIITPSYRAWVLGRPGRRSTRIRW